MTSDNVIVQAFTEMAPQYEDTMNRELEQYWGISYHTFIERFLEQVSITAGDAILDVATGTARIPRALRDRVGADGCIVGLDITPAMLARGRAHGVADGGRAAVHLVCGSALELPFGDATYDGVVCALGTHHMDVPRMVAEMRRVLRPGGWLALADVGATWFWRSVFGRLLLWILMVQYGLEHRSARGKAERDAFANVRTVSEWEALLEEHCFGAMRVQEVRARRPWYPCGLVIVAVASGA